MKAARILEYKKPLVFADIPIPDIQADEVLVKVEACGMCRSDVLLVDGFFQNYASIPPPVIQGHEITGTIHRIGSVIPKAAGLSEGDHVVVAPGWGDGVCRHCQVGNTHICPNVRWPGFGTYGGFAEYIPVPARYVIKVAKHLKFEELAPLTDAGLTPYRGMKKIRDAGPIGWSACLASAASAPMPFNTPSCSAPVPRSSRSRAIRTSLRLQSNVVPTTSSLSRESPQATLGMSSRRPPARTSSMRSSTALARRR